MSGPGGSNQFTQVSLFVIFHCTGQSTILNVIYQIDANTNQAINTNLNEATGPQTTSISERTEIVSGPGGSNPLTEASLLTFFCLISLLVK